MLYIRRTAIQLKKPGRGEDCIKVFIRSGENDFGSYFFIAEAVTEGRRIKPAKQISNGVPDEQGVLKWIFTILLLM
jgi:hypothetical protein